MVNKNILSKFDNNLTLQYSDGWMKNNGRGKFRRVTVCDTKLMVLVFLIHHIFLKVLIRGDFSSFNVDIELFGIFQGSFEVQWSIPVIKPYMNLNTKLNNPTLPS